MKETLKKDLEKYIVDRKKPSLKVYICDTLSDISDIEIQTLKFKSPIAFHFLQYCNVPTCTDKCTVRCLQVVKYGVLPLRLEKIQK